ncbi:DUF6502 family protein [Jannaschia pohangensis]|uniref:Uncharacterized protein n=1 Tax=Jannaschia pohangensis TaxID=390807 RepID=A0A1I3R170_9RHOB|nr:DUF6502 family protein [Jannaschia pohangensis]SFJ39469.1 hypothetical protein SAMN04488095_2731 [Jannaschia pohangensis]
MTTDPSDKMLRILRGLLRPLVRTLIARGVTAPTFYRLLKSVYVEVAREAFRLDDAPPTDSRVSLLTGVHRRDIRTILAEGDTAWEAARSRSATLATVLARWQTLDGFSDNGVARPLPRTGAPGADFESLVTTVSTDIRPRTILDELLNQGLVAETSDSRIAPTGPPVVGPGSDDHKLVFFAANVGDHLAAASENLLTETPPFFERAVFYNRLTPNAIEQIEARARILSQAMLEEINATSAAHQTAERLAKDNTGRYRLGVYFYREDSAAPQDDKDESK